MKLISRLCNGFCMSLSMFSIIPCPQIWDDSAIVLVLPMLPLIGAVIGAFWYAFSALLSWISAPIMLRAALVLLFPLFMSGFLHIDGYMDTCDAIFSRAELSKKLAILKDSHVGAFAVIALCVYLLTGFAAVYTALERGSDLTALYFLPILSRCVAGIAALNIKPISESGYAASFRKNAISAHTAALVVQGVLCLTASALLADVKLLAVMCATLAGGLMFCFYSARQLGGISGDLCGFIIVGGELCALLALSVL